MVNGTGIDIIEIERIKAAASRSKRFLQRIFTSSELEYCQQRNNPWPCLAARFAAKEAVIKAFAGQGGPFSLCDIEVIKEGQVPGIRLHGAAAQTARDAGVAFTLTMSHSRDYAVAMAIAVSAEYKEE